MRHAIPQHARPPSEQYREAEQQRVHKCRFISREGVQLNSYIYCVSLEV